MYKPRFLGRAKDFFFNGRQLLLRSHKGATAAEKLRLLRAHCAYRLGSQPITHVRATSADIYDKIFERRLRKIGSLPRR